jgi:hypothetical protein
MARRFTNASMVKGFLVAGLLAFAGPALAAPGAQGPNAHSQSKSAKGHKSESYQQAPKVVVVTQNPKRTQRQEKQRDRVVVTTNPKRSQRQDKQRDRAVAVAAPRLVLRGEPRVTVQYGPQVVHTAPRPAQERPSQALRARFEGAQSSGRLNLRELRRLEVALQRVEAAERRFFRDDRRLDRSELRTLARLEASFDLSFQQAMRGRGRA